MKTPDKIYVAISKFMCPGLASCSKLKDDMTEYIRKDALLEWAKDLKHVYEIPVNNHQVSEICCAKAKAFQTVIDKIESL